MCSLDDSEVCDIWSQVWARARKPSHQCHVCRLSIALGDMYIRFKSLYDGEWTQERACAVCGTMWQDFSDAHSFGFQPSMFVESLEECIADDGGGTLAWGAGYFSSLAESKEQREKLRAVDGKWRTYLAIVKWRKRHTK